MNATGHAAIAGKKRTNIDRIAWGLCIFVAIAVGRATEMLPGMQSLPLAKVAMGATIIFALANRSSLASVDLWKFSVSRYAILFFLLIVASLSFSIWKGITLRMITGSALTNIVSVLLIIKASSSWRPVKIMLAGGVWAAGILVVASLVAYGGGRLGTSGSYDSNDLAMVLNSLLPLVIAFAVISSGSRKLVLLGLACVIVPTVLLTQSRGGLLGLAVLALYFGLSPLSKDPTRELKQRRMSSRLVRFGALALIGLLAWQVLPGEAQSRLGTIFSLGSDYNTNMEEEGRFAIWQRNLKQVGKRPWGFGAGAFLAVDGFGGGRYRAAHNTPLEILVELGVLGLLLFFAICFTTLRNLDRLLQSITSADKLSIEDSERRVFARALRMSIVTALVCCFFLSMSYSPAVWLLLALSAAVCVSVADPLVPATPVAPVIKSSLRQVQAPPRTRS